LGNGDGTFRAPTVYNSLGARQVTVADVNLDGKLDLLVANWSSAPDDDPSRLVGVLLGNGDGTFQPGVTYGSGGTGAISISAQDVNGDGRPDLLVMSQGGIDGSRPGVVGVLLGNGDGTFQPAVAYIPGQDFLNSLAVVDVDGDHHPDLLVTSGTSDDWVNGVISLMRGNGDGTFQVAENYDSGGFGAGSISLGDVNGDNRPDLFVGNYRVLYPHGYQPGFGMLLNNAGAPHTTTTTVSSLNPALPRQTVTYTATVTPESRGAVTGTVTFRDGSASRIVPLSGNQAMYTNRYKRASMREITAVYSGDLQNAGSTSASFTEYIQGTSRTGLITTGSPSFVGQPVTFTATVSSTDPVVGKIPDGEVVTFYDGSTMLNSVALAGGVAHYTTSSLTAKTHYIKATYAGDSLFKPSHGTVTQVVEKYSTTTTLSSTRNPSAYGQAVTFTATVASAGPEPTGKITFKDGATTIGTAGLSGGVAILTKSKLAVGTHPITAQYLGDAASAKGTSPVLNQVVQ